MTPERWQRVDALFQAALDCAPEARIAFVASACPGDPALRNEVEKLLASFDAAGNFLEQPAADSLGFDQTPAPVPSLTPGQKLAHYEIISLLGSGGMGEVYLARDTKLDRRIALKLLPAHFAADPERVSRFEREARAASALNHPNIITIHEIGQQDGKHFIATEYIAGETLRQRLNRGPLVRHEAVTIARQIAGAIAAAHRAGIVHRDIKPENVMIWPDGLVKVVDFGLAKPLDQESEAQPDSGSSPHTPDTDPDFLIGTLNYLSPEQVRREKLDPRTDIFSLGVVFYEMLAGTRPFFGPTPAEVCAAILHRDPPHLKEPALSRIANRALAKTQDDRYQTAAEFEADLLATRLMSTSRASRLWMRAAVAAVVLLVVLIAFGLWKMRQTTPPAAQAFTPLTRQKLTDLVGQELFPSLAPDGQSFVFASSRRGDWDIYRQTIGARDAVNLTADSSSYDNQPAFSPDGKRITFCSSRDGNGIYVMNSDGSNVQKLTEGGNNPAWSPEGREIVFADERIWDHEVRTTFPGSSRLWAVDVETHQRRLITAHDAVQPSWSPSGDRIAFWGEHNGRQRDIWTVAASGVGDPVPVTDDAAVDWNPVWSPDGRQLLFLSNRGGSVNLWRVALGQSGDVQGEPEPILASENTQHVCLARDGRGLIYTQVNRSENLWQVGFDPVTGKIKDTPTPLTQGLKRYGMFALAPDEQTFAYVGLGEPQMDLFVSKIDGTLLRRLTDDSAHDNVPRWSADGEQIAFVSDRSGKQEIWRTRMDGTEPEQLTDVPARDVIDPVWSPDGKRLLYQIRNVNSFIIDVDEPGTIRTPQPLAGQPLPGFLVWDWSRDGNLLAGWQPGQERPERGIGVYSFARQSYERLTDFGEFPVWLNDNRRLLFVSFRELYLLDRMGGRPQALLSTSPNEIGLIALSRDNRRLYFTRRSNEADIWLLKLE